MLTRFYQIITPLEKYKRIRHDIYSIYFYLCKNNKNAQDKLPKLTISELKNKVINEQNKTESYEQFDILNKITILEKISKCIIIGSIIIGFILMQISVKLGRSFIKTVQDFSFNFLDIIIFFTQFGLSALNLLFITFFIFLTISFLSSYRDYISRELVYDHEDAHKTRNSNELNSMWIWNSTLRGDIYYMIPILAFIRILSKKLYNKIFILFINASYKFNDSEDIQSIYNKIKEDNEI